MNPEKIIIKIGNTLETFKFPEANETTKLEALNIANTILYPLKETKVIEDYQFAAKVNESSLYVTVTIRDANNEESSWDIILSADV